MLTISILTPTLTTGNILITIVCWGLLNMINVEIDYFIVGDFIILLNFMKLPIHHRQYYQNLKFHTQQYGKHIPFYDNIRYERMEELFIKIINFSIFVIFHIGIIFNNLNLILIIIFFFHTRIDYILNCRKI